MLDSLTAAGRKEGRKEPVLSIYLHCCNHYTGEQIKHAILVPPILDLILGIFDPLKNTMTFISI